MQATIDNQKLEVDDNKKSELPFTPRSSLNKPIRRMSHEEVKQKLEELRRGSVVLLPPNSGGGCFATSMIQHHY